MPYQQRNRVAGVNPEIIVPLSLCILHECRCGTLVNAYGLHAMVCKKAPGKHARHHASNDIIWRAFGTASTPDVKEPSGLCRNDGKRPDGLTLTSWQEGKPLVWDATVVTPLAIFYVDRAATGASVVSDLAADRKLDKYSSLSSAYTIQPIAADNNDPIETLYLFQRISVALQCFNSVLLQTTHQTNRHSQLFLSHLFFSILVLYTLGHKNYHTNNNYYYYSAPIVVRCIVINPSVCVSVSPQAYLWNCSTDPRKILYADPRGRGSVLLWRRCATLCTFGFMDDNTFSRNGRDADTWRLHCTATAMSSVAIPGRSLMFMDVCY